MPDHIVVPGKTIPSNTYSLTNLAIDLVSGKATAGTRNTDGSKLSFERQFGSSLQVIIGAEDLATIKTIFFNAVAEQVSDVTLE
jgi:hypothetical protein